MAQVRGGGGGASMCRSGVRGANYGKVEGGQVWVGRGVESMVSQVFRKGVGI